MKDASKRFFDIAGSHPNALLRAAVDYQPPHPTHHIRRPRNVLTDPPDAHLKGIFLVDKNLILSSLLVAWSGNFCPRSRFTSYVPTQKKKRLISSSVTADNGKCRRREEAACSPKVKPLCDLMHR
ncbi:hypothetical protein EVAR_13953_1 [Eumeta japonica]|uniref:Uncharacterized protein n=1 Tax=Eumeta variegata TaxID=151549 RepID=A0A4C1U8F8_EUMVA|nr:hypothetical protein EVAR_13953_1 [Eumeta japonica]